MKEYQSKVRHGALISSLRVEKNDRHHHIHIWNRGAKAGILCVNAEDGDAIVNFLSGGVPWEFTFTQGQEDS